MKTQTLISSVAAVLFTAVSLNAVNYNVPRQSAPATVINGTKVTNLAPVTVQPSANEWRAAALLVDIGPAGLATVPVLNREGAASGMQPLSLISSQLVMPYYSFGKKFGRISKE